MFESVGLQFLKPVFETVFGYGVHEKFVLEGVKNSRFKGTK